MLGRRRKPDPCEEHARKLAEAAAADEQATAALERAKKARIEARKLSWRLRSIADENHFAAAVRRVLEGDV